MSGTTLLSDERIRDLIKIWASDNPGIEGSIYEGTYPQDIYLLLMAEKGRREADVAPPSPSLPDGEMLAKKLDECGTRHNKPRDGMVFMSICDEAAAFIRSQASTIEALEAERDEAQSVCTAWEQAFSSIEAHIKDRINMRDPADPERYLRIIRYDVAHIIEGSKRIVASRWHDYSQHEARIASLESALATSRAEVERLREASYELEVHVETARKLLAKDAIEGFPTPLQFRRLTDHLARAVSLLKGEAE